MTPNADSAPLQAGEPSVQRAEFVDRMRCIACGSPELEQLSTGAYADEPLHGILASQAWGEHPLPFIAHERWHYVRCRACAQAFHRRILAPAWMERLYARWETQASMEAFSDANTPRSERLDRGAHFVGHALRLQQMTRALAEKSPVSLLDYGCGHGEFVSVCRVLGFDAVGIDFAPDRQRHGMVPMYGSLEALREALPAEPRFQVVTMFEVLEHLADPRPTLERLAALMPAGALLILETPDTTGVTDVRSFDDYLAIAPLGHVNGFTPATLRAIAERAGFRAVRPPPLWMSMRWDRAVKDWARALLAPWRRPSTSQYFQRV